MKKFFVFVTVVTLVFGLTGCAKKRECLYPGCNNEAIGDTGACYKHGKNNSSQSSHINDDNETDVYYSHSTDGNKSGVDNSYNSSSNKDRDYSSSSSSSSKSYNSDMYNYDNVDDYAEDKFGDTESEEAYEYGYEEAYDDWEEEMDE